MQQRDMQSRSLHLFRLFSEEAEKVGARISNLFPWSSPTERSNRRNGEREAGGKGGKGGADGRREFMCLGRVKGTRVATSAANGRRTAGCNTGGEKPKPGERGEKGRRGAKGGMTRGMDALARHARVIETNSIPRIVSDARTRRGDDRPFWNQGESAVSRIREGYGRAQNPTDPLQRAGVESA